MKQPELGKKVLELRLSKGLTQTELAQLCNVSTRTIQRIEANEVTPRSFTTRTIFSALDHSFYNSPLVEPVSEKTSSFKSSLEDLLNFKKNTMKKLSVLGVLFTLIMLFFLKTESNAQSIDGWFKAGSKRKSYEIGLTSTQNQNGKKCAYIKSIDTQIDGFGTLMQTCNAKFYLGKRIRMTGYVKTVAVNNWSGMWLRIDGKDENGKRKTLSFDNMYNRHLSGDTDWQKCQIILNVPRESTTMNFGVLVNGTGEAYFDRISFEILGDITDGTPNALPDKPANIDFEN